MTDIENKQVRVQTVQNSIMMLINTVPIKPVWSSYVSEEKEVQPGSTFICNNQYESAQALEQLKIKTALLL